MKLKEIIGPTIISLCILLVLNILLTATLPVLGLNTFKVPFNILIILFLSFKIRYSFLAIIIFLVQYLNSFFTLEHWSLGTIAGILTLWLMNYLKDVIHLSSYALTVLITLLFSLFWFLVTSILVYMQVSEVAVIFNRFWNFLPQAFLISLISPLFFAILSKIWSSEQSSGLEA